MNISEKVKSNREMIRQLEKVNAEVEFYNSLIASVRIAGGCIDWLDENTTLKDLANCLAINGIRFHYVGERGIK